MLNLKSFHLVLAFLANVLTAGVGTWGVLHQFVVGGAIPLVVSALLIGYVAYVAGQAPRIPE